MNQEDLKKILDYNEETGVFVWKTNRGRCIKAGDVTTGNSEGIIRINKRKYTKIRLAWMYVHGEFPEGLVYTLDGNASNAAISNLYTKNVPRSGVRGIIWNEKHNRWYVVFYFAGKKRYIFAGKRRHIGTYSDLEDAKAALQKAQKRYEADPILFEQLSVPRIKPKRSGIVGIAWNKKYNRWQVSLNIAHKQKHFGSYSDLKDAKVALRAAQEKHNLFIN